MPVLFLNTTLQNSTGKPGLLYCTNDVIVDTAYNAVVPELLKQIVSYRQKLWFRIQYVNTSLHNSHRGQEEHESSHIVAINMIGSIGRTMHNVPWDGVPRRGDQSSSR